MAPTGAGETQDARQRKHTDECDDGEAGVTRGDSDGGCRSYRDEAPDWTSGTVHGVSPRWVDETPLSIATPCEWRVKRAGRSRNLPLQRQLAGDGTLQF